MRVFVAALCTVFLAHSMVVSADDTYSKPWNDAAQKELNDALKLKLNTNVAKNVIIFLGDGMGVSTVTAGRIYKGQLQGQPGEGTLLAFDSFPHVALSKTYNANKQTPDSAGTATAFMCGVKANYGTVGVDERVTRGNCSSQKGAELTSILKWSRDAGKNAGLISTARVTHATPAAGYAHTAERNWEGDVEIAEQNLTGQCTDIAVQLLENIDLQVIMGGGRRYFLLNNQTDPEYGTTDDLQRADGRDLIKEWKSTRGSKSKYVWNKAEFDAVNPADTDYLLGLFEPSHMQYDLERNKTMEPSIADLTEKAINILKKNDKGYFLLVEGGRIDHGHHENYAKKALHDVVAMDEAVERAVKVTNEQDTLIVVTADHSHVFMMGGYPDKGSDILGFAESTSEWYAPTDEMPKTTLIYGNGPGPRRTNLTNVDTHADDFMFPTAVASSYETHGGEDVAIYARGPMAHLFHGVHEENYIAHAMAYASCVGRNKKHCEEPTTKGDQTNASGITKVNNLVCIAAIFTFLLSVKN